jgi:hypothetical protein
MADSYSSDELKTLVRILNEILVKARTCRPDLSTSEIVERVCALADGGERDADNLHNAVFGTELRSAVAPTELSLAEMQRATRTYASSRRYPLA